MVGKFIRAVGDGGRVSLQASWRMGDVDAKATSREMMRGVFMFGRAEISMRLRNGCDGLDCNWIVVAELFSLESAV